MNYFELYPGDYLRDTTRLSLVEHGAYLRLLMAYYAEEQPLPADEAELFVIVSAVSAADKAAVRKVASRFFPVGDDGLRRNGRADEEIEKAQRRIAISRENGSKGGRKKNPTGNPTGNPAGNPAGSSQGNPAGTQQGTRSGEALHTPHAIHHQEQKPSPSSSVAGQPARPPAGLTDDDDGPVPGEQDLPSWIPRPLWREFYRHRAVLRKPLSIPGQRQVVRRLVELSEAGHDIAASLRQTMAAGLVIPVTPKDHDHADVPASRKLSAVDQVAAKIRERREREHADNEPPFATLGHG
jgi:uncharacterized protein YdaU (DUF1376 family)